MIHNHALLAIMGIFLLMSATALPSAFAYWHVGAKKISINPVEARADASVPAVPSSGVLTTLFWLGADSNGGSGYLVQPELRDWTDANGHRWRGTFETVSYSGGQVEFFYTNIYFSGSGGGQVQFDTLLSGGQNWQYLTDKNNSLNTASRWFSAVNYGTQFVAVYTTLESYDYTSSKFSPMGNTYFTNVKTYNTIGGAPTSPVLSAYRYSSTSTPAPSCIQSSGGTGAATITENC